MNKDRELIGYTCTFCKTLYGITPNILDDRVCYFDKDEMIENQYFHCKDGSGERIECNGNDHVRKVYRK